MAQLVASMSGVVLGGVVMVVGSNLAKGKIFTASIGSVDSLYPSVYKKLYILVYIIYKKKIYIHEKKVFQKANVYRELEVERTLTPNQ